jgi:Tfp pilus assembly protein PilF
MPDHIGTWHVLAWIEILLGNVPAAHSAFRRALALDRNFSETHGGLAVVDALQGREAEARLHIKRALRLDRQSVAVCYAELLLLRREGKTAQAKAVIDELLARPASAEGLQYRDLVEAHLRTAALH